MGIVITFFGVLFVGTYIQSEVWCVLLANLSYNLCAEVQLKKHIFKTRQEVL